MFRLQKETQVPFKPTEDRPVYCRDCYQKHRPPRKILKIEEIIFFKKIHFFLC